MHTVEAFQDQIWALAEVKKVTGVTSRADVMANPDTGEVLQTMETMVVECPEITEFYGGALKKYREGDPDSVAAELAVIKERVDLMSAETIDGEPLLSAAQTKKLREQISTGEIVREEADVFFSMFKRVIPKELLPTTAKPRSSPATSRGPNQARKIDLEITEHGGIRINGKFLRALTAAQKLIIMAGLAKGTGFRNQEVYLSDEFAQIVGTAASEDQRREVYTDELKSLQLFLKENRFGRLLDANRKPGERKHTVTAHSVVDQRRIKPSVRPVAVIEAPVRMPRFYEAVEDIKDEAGGRRPEATADFLSDTIRDAHQLLLTEVSGPKQVKRVDFIESVALKFGIDTKQAQKLVTAAFKFERESESPRLRQVKVKGGAKYFARINHVDKEAEEEVSMFGQYFNGTPEQFFAKHGVVKGLVPEYVNFERGIVSLEGNERELLRYFERTGIRRAIAEKTVVSDLAQRGIEITKEDIRAAVTVINNLYGRPFLVSLAPATRMDAAKGPRVQKVGSFTGE